MLLLRLLAFLLGTIFFGISVLIRYLPAFISVGSWRIYLKFFRPDLVDWIQIPLSPAILVVVVLLAGLVFLSPAGRAIWRRLRDDRLNRYWALGWFLLLGLTLLPPSHPADNLYLAGQELAAYIIFGSAGTGFLLFGLGRALDPAGRILAQAYRRLVSLNPRTFVWLAAGWVFLAASLASWLVFDHIPHVQDTIAQVFQARLFAAGRFYLPSPPLPQFFDLMHVINDGRWYSQYPPGHPLLLALGVLIRAPWLINPLLGGLTVVVIYLLGRELYDDPTARIAVLLSCLSPFLIFMSSEFMNHSSALLFACLFLLFFARSVQDETGMAALLNSPSAIRSSHSALRSSLLAGLCLGMVVLIRPFTALLIAVPFVIAAVVQISLEPKPRLARWWLMLAGGAFMVGILLLYNYLTNGNPFELGYTAKYGASHSIGLGQGAFGEKLTLPSAIIETNLDLNGLNRYLFEFPIPSLLFIAVLFAWGRRQKWDFLLLSTVVMLVGGYFFYFWHSTVLFGPRWEYESFGALVLLSARGIRTVTGEQIADSSRPTSERATAQLHSTTWSLFLLCYLSMLAVAVPTLVQKYRQGFGVSASTARTIARAGLSNAVVLARDPGEVALHNNLALDGNIVYARDLGPLNPVLARQYPGRRFFFANRDTLQELTDLSFDHSALRQGLDSVAAYLGQNDLRGYRCLFFPLAELAGMVDPLARKAGLTVRDYRSLDVELIRHQELETLLPALAVWVIGDPSQHLQLFAFMDEAQNFQVGDVRFTHIMTSPDSSVALFDVQAAPPGR
jgi:hypothetical protein